MRENPTLRLDGEITESTPRDVAAFLKAAVGAPVQITIHSPGGNALAGAGAYGQLRAYRGRVEVIVEGIAASAASLIAMAASPGLLKIHGGSFLMIHDPHTAAVGQAADLRQTADVLDRVAATYRRAYAERSGKSEAEIAALMEAETWLSAEEAVAMGLADAVIEPLRIAASVDLSAFDYRNAPRALRHGAQGEPVMSVTIENQPAEVQAATAQEITAIAARANLGADFVARQLEARATVVDVQGAALDAMAAASVSAVTPSTLRIIRDEGDTAREAQAEYVASRIMGRAPAGPAAALRGHSIADIFAELLDRRGERLPRGASPEKVFARLTTSDLPNLLSNGAARAMAELYPTVRTPLVALAQVRELPDFRPTTLIRLAQHVPLSPVNEAGEVTAAYPNENGEQIRLATFASRFIISREALVNDDLNGLADWMNAAAQGAAARERLLASGLLTAGSGAGPTLSDGIAWFHANRNNIGTAATINATSLAEAVGLMRALRDSLGNTVFALEPGSIVVSPAREFVARQMVAGIAAATTRADVQPYSLDVIVEPALTGNRWWLAPRPVTRRCLTMAYLDGRQEPTVETFTDAGTLGATMRVVFDCAAAVQDPIGWVMNPGA